MTRRRNQPPDPAREHPEPTDARPSPGANRQVTPAGGGDSPPTGESRYRRRRTPAPEEPPLVVRVEFVVLDGEAGRQLRRNQAQIMREVLQWIAEHPDPASR